MAMLVECAIKSRIVVGARMIEWGPRTTAAPQFSARRSRGQQDERDQHR